MRATPHPPTRQGYAVDPTLEIALAPVLRDLRATAGLDLTIRDETWPGAPSGSVVVLEPSGSGTGVYLSEDEPVAQIADAAEQVQEIVIEALWHARRPVSWPMCPEHPTTHPLAVDIVEQRVVWSCPVTKTAFAEVGKLSEGQ
jgi:hypothetical protein